jgi:hypothetical protein
MRHRGLSFIWGSLMLAACSTAQPILYPNAHLQSVGKEIAAQDIEACRKLAESAGAEGGGTGKAGRVATSTAVGAVGGAISGSVGYGAMIGAATGAVWGFLMGLFRESKSPQQNQAYTNFVNRCLQEKGYEVTGWQ